MPCQDLIIPTIQIHFYLYVSVDSDSFKALHLIFR